MKKFKNNKSLIIGLASVLGVASLASVAGVTASQMVKTDSANADKSAPFQAVTHHTVQFVKPTGTDYDDLRYEGRTTLDVKDGYPFGILAAPNPIYVGYVFDHWEFATGSQAGTTIEKSTPITEDCTIVPVMLPEQSDIVISGDHDLYDGLYQAKIYTLSAGSEIIPADITWSAVEADGTTVSTDVTVTPVPNTTTCSVIANDTLTAQTCYLKATYGTGVTQKVTMFELNVYPPYYYVGEETITGVTYDYGKCYWVHFPETAGHWEAITEESVCSQTAPFVTIRHASETPSVVQFTRNSDDIADWIDIFPGCEINLIGDNFMAQAVSFNAKLHGGVNPITKQPKVLSGVEDNFLQDCTSFNQDISALFTLGADYSITLGHHFMEGCTTFANGGEEFVLPTAIMYGDYFMNGCTALTGEIVFGSQVVKVGDYFMNDTGISSVTIPSTFGGDAMEDNGIGAFFLTDCENLDHVTILTDDVTYFNELSMPAQDRGSFVRFTPYEDETGITLLCPNASQQFLDGFTELDGTDGYYRHFTLDTDSHIRSWDYAGPSGTFKEFVNPYDPLAETTFVDEAAATTAYSNAIAANPDLFLADLFTQESMLHNGSPIDTLTITLKNLDTTNPAAPRMSINVQMNQTREMPGLLNMTQTCNLEFNNIPFGIFNYEGTPTIGSTYIFESTLMSEISDWETTLALLQDDTTWSIKGNAYVFFEATNPEYEALELDKTWNNLNINSTNVASSDFMTYTHAMIEHPYAMFILSLGYGSNYLQNCSFDE